MLVVFQYIVKHHTHYNRRHCIWSPRCFILIAFFIFSGVLIMSFTNGLGVLCVLVDASLEGRQTLGNPSSFCFLPLDPHAGKVPSVMYAVKFLQLSAVQRSKLPLFAFVVGLVLPSLARAMLRYALCLVCGILFYFSILFIDFIFFIYFISIS